MLLPFWRFLPPPPQVRLVRSAGLAFMAHRSNRAAGVTIHGDPTSGKFTNVAVRWTFADDYGLVPLLTQVHSARLLGRLLHHEC